MFVLLRRFCVLAAMMFWQGGFTFYAAVVVPVGADVLGTHLEQGFITQNVSNYLNLAGGVALLVLAWELATQVDPMRWRWWCRGIAWGMMVATLAVLLWLHIRLDSLVDPEQQIILDRDVFVPLHRLYLYVSTLQWLAGLAMLVLCLHLWGAREATGDRPG
jgi:hypothetical protein